MLNQVKNDIKSLTGDSFDEHLLSYIMNIQDRLIDEEINFVSSKNTSLDNIDVINIINDQLGGMNPL